MSYMKHRCKNYYVCDCPNWVWIANTACTTCIAAGRDEEQGLPLHQQYARRDVLVPQLQDGSLEYTMMEIVEPTEPGATWMLCKKQLD